MSNFTATIVARAVEDKSIEDIRGIIDGLPVDREEAISLFCDLFDLGNWVYEQLILDKSDVADELTYLRDISTKKDQDNREIARDYAMAAS